MSKFNIQTQQLMVKAISLYVDDQANHFIRQGINHHKARLLFSVLGHYMYDDLLASAECIKTLQEGGSYAETLRFLEDFIRHHPLEKVMVSLFHETLSAAFEACFEEEQPQLALTRMRQFEHQIRSSWNAELEDIETDWTTVVDDILLLDRRWFRYCRTDGAVVVAEKKSDRLRRYIHSALNVMREVERELQTPAGILNGLLTVAKYIARMEKAGIAYPPPAQTQPKRKPGGGGFGKGGDRP